MPSWKKVIISGSDAALNSLTVSNGITGSLFGTSSWASNAQTASFVTASNVYGPFGSNSILSSSRAVSSSFATSAASASSIEVTNDISTNANYFPLFASTTSGNTAARVDSTGLLYNPSTKYINNQYISRNFIRSSYNSHKC